MDPNKENIENIPVALQHHIIVQVAVAVASLILGIAAWAFLTWTMAIPFFTLAVLLAANAAKVTYAVAHRRCLALHGVVLHTERTAFLRRSKALLLEVEGHALRVVLRNRLRPLQDGAQVTLYVMDSTMIYEWRGIHQLHTYLALAEGAQAQHST